MKSVTILIVLLFAGAIWLGIVGAEQQQQYRADHHCRKVGAKDAQSGFGLTSSGDFATTYIPEQDIYSCDGGEILIQ